MSTLTQQTIGLSERIHRGRDLQLSRQNRFADATLQRPAGLESRLILRPDDRGISYGFGAYTIQIAGSQTLVQMLPIGLSEALAGRSGISAFLTKADLQTEQALTKTPSYLKNGILVHHGGYRITSEDVAEALDEE